ncbi:putative MYND domain protein [Xylaria arbuscula]|nr:putative MYND domain protein [Xylaria arbuscula]
MQGTCNGCNKTSSDLKRCAKCATTLYCSRECQKTDWKTHKKICGKQAHERPETRSHASAATVLSPPKGLEQPITKPFSRLDDNTYLHNRPETDVYRLLIDSYRMRLDDEYTFDGDAAVDSIYGGAKSSITGFRKFLRQAASRRGVLPPWWTAEKQAACEKLGMDRKEWQDLHCAVEKSDVIEHYGDPRFPMQLRMLAEAIMGRSFGGNDGTHMRKMMAMMENGGVGGNQHSAMSTVDVLTGNFSTLTAS